MKKIISAFIFCFLSSIHSFSHAVTISSGCNTNIVTEYDHYTGESWTTPVGEYCYESTTTQITGYVDIYFHDPATNQIIPVEGDHQVTGNITYTSWTDEYWYFSQEFYFGNDISGSFTVHSDNLADPGYVFTISEVYDDSEAYNTGYGDPVFVSRTLSETGTDFLPIVFETDWEIINTGNGISLTTLDGNNDGAPGVVFGPEPSIPWVTVDYHISSVPVPVAVWLFSSGLICLVGFARRKKA